ncbi:MAG: hypothetical protein PUB97_10085 [Ruminococcus sp.]|nr:hypothetical protein [Ruminococcus sp.]
MKKITFNALLNHKAHNYIIRDYLYERDENDEYFFGIPKGNKLEVYLLTSPENLYEYLAEKSEGLVY